MKLAESNANYIGGDIIGGANSETQVVLRPRIALDPYSTGGTGNLSVLGVHAAGSRRPRDERIQRRPIRTAPPAQTRRRCAVTVERSGKRNRRGAAFLERHGPIAVITLNRPEVRNVVNSDVSAAVGAAMETLAHSPDLRVGILTGAGDTFCAGADLAALTAGHSIDAPGHPEWGFGGFVRHDIGKPLIAAVNGSSSGGGLDLILACDAASSVLTPRSGRGE